MKSKLEKYKYKTGDIVKTVPVKLYDDLGTYEASSQHAIILERRRRSRSDMHRLAMYWAIFQGCKTNRTLLLMQVDIVGKIGE